MSAENLPVTPLSKHCAIVWWFYQHPRTIVDPVEPPTPPEEKYNARRADLQGQVFGRWTVGERGAPDKQGRPRWKVTCSCGKTGLVRTADLNKGDSKSCGCLAKELRDAQKRRF